MAYSPATGSTVGSGANHLADVRAYYTRNVERQIESVKQLVSVTNHAVHRMLEYINGEDRRFERNPVGAGSLTQSLMVSKADEFDYNIQLKCDTSRWAWCGESIATSSWHGSLADRDRCLARDGRPSALAGGRCWQLSKVTKDPVESMDATLEIVNASQPLPPPRPGYTFIYANCLDNGTPTAAASWSDLCHGGDMNPFLVRRRLHRLMEYAIQRGKLSGIKCKLKPKLSGPALTFIITTAGNEEISIDLVPCFNVPHLWPNGSDWPREETNRWLLPSKIDKIKAKGIQLVPKRNFHWLISFNFAETELLDGIDTGTGCRKLSLRIVKHLRIKYWCKMTKPPVSSYLLKHLLFWECEKFPRDEDWAPGMLWERVLGITMRLLACLQEEHARHYFYPTINHLADKDHFEILSIRKAVEKFVNNPSPFLKES